MAVQTAFAPQELAGILSGYDLGRYRRADGIGQGTVQTNLLLETAGGRFVFRYYENRSRESVLFERDLLLYLGERDYPCPAPLPDRQGEYVGLHRGKPYMIFPFVEGQHVEQPGAGHRTQLVRWAAELQKQTRGFRSPYTPYRWNYGPVLCLRLARGQAARLDTSAAYRKLAWMAHEIAALDLPPELPRGICHCDFDVSNVLFRGDELVALIDFDDANWTYLPFDLVGLVEAWAWPHTAEALDLVAARRIVRAYEQHRPLGDEEREHVYDVYKLSILFDCVWFFGRGEGEDFYEKRKIEALASLGRQGFCEALFGG